jgi:phytoene dehydrogenase-like protein
MQHPQGSLWMRRYRQSAMEIVEEYFEHEYTRSFILWLAHLTIQPVDRAFTGRLAWALAYGRQTVSWTTPQGGSQSLPNALVRLIETHGGTCLTDKQVAELIIEGDQCVGVVTADGEQYRAGKAVLSTIHIKHLVDMAPREQWGDIFSESVEQWQPGLTLFAAHYALSEAPLYPIGDGRAPCVALGTLESLDEMRNTIRAFQRGEISQEKPVLLVLNSTAVDDTRTPPGHHTFKVVCLAPYDLADGGPARWDDIKEDVAARNLEYLRQYAPNLTDDVILASHIESPLDLERRNLHNYRGSCHGGDLSPAQSGAMRPVPGWASHRMPIKGLYQTGGTTHPGGSVSAGPGRNAAWVILDDLGIPFESVIAKNTATAK